MKNRDPWLNSDLQPSARHGRRDAGRDYDVEAVMVSAQTACRILGDIDEKTLRAWRTLGLLDGTWCKIGGRVLFNLSELREWSKKACIDNPPRHHSDFSTPDGKEA